MSSSISHKMLKIFTSIIVCIWSYVSVDKKCNLSNCRHDLDKNDHKFLLFIMRIENSFVPNGGKYGRCSKRGKYLKRGQQNDLIYIFLLTCIRVAAVVSMLLL